MADFITTFPQGDAAQTSLQDVIKEVWIVWLDITCPQCDTRLLRLSAVRRDLLKREEATSQGSRVPNCLGRMTSKHRAYLTSVGENTQHLNVDVVSRTPPHKPSMEYARCLDAQPVAQQRCQGSTPSEQKCSRAHKLAQLPMVVNNGSSPHRAGGRACPSDAAHALLMVCGVLALCPTHPSATRPNYNTSKARLHISRCESPCRRCLLVSKARMLKFQAMPWTLGFRVLFMHFPLHFRMFFSTESPTRRSIAEAPTRDAHQWQQNTSNPVVPQLDARLHCGPSDRSQMKVIV